MNYLAPLDFSDQSKHAASYAASLNNVWPGSLHLLHIIERAEEDASYIPVKTMNVRKNTVFEMFQFQEQLRKEFGLRTGADMIVGDFTSGVMQIAAEKKSDLIVIGMQGESGLREHLFGSRAAELVATSTLPVLAIPAEVDFKPFRHIVYVTEYKETELENVTALAKIAAKFKGVLSIISINPKPGRANDEFKEAVKQKVPFAAINFEERRSDDGTAAELAAFALTQSVDLIGVSATQTDLVQKIMGRDVLREYSFDVDLPLLFLPE